MEEEENEKEEVKKKEVEMKRMVEIWRNRWIHNWG